jgi:hypothetical protein
MIAVLIGIVLVIVAAVEWLGHLTTAHAVAILIGASASCSSSGGRPRRPRSHAGTSKAQPRPARTAADSERRDMGPRGAALPHPGPACADTRMPATSGALLLTSQRQCGRYALS